MKRFIRSLLLFAVASISYAAPVQLHREPDETLVARVDRTSALGGLVHSTAEFIDQSTIRLAGNIDSNRGTAASEVKGDDLLTRVRRDPIAVEFLSRPRGHGGGRIPIVPAKLEELRRLLPPARTMLTNRARDVWMARANPWILKNQDVPDAHRYLRLQEVKRLTKILRNADNARSKARRMQHSGIESPDLPLSRPQADSDLSSEQGKQAETSGTRPRQNDAEEQLQRQAKRQGGMNVAASTPINGPEPGAYSHSETGEVPDRRQMLENDHSSPTRSFWTAPVDSRPSWGLNIREFHHSRSSAERFPPQSASAISFSAHVPALNEDVTADIRKYLFGEDV